MDLASLALLTALAAPPASPTPDLDAAINEARSRFDSAWLYDMMTVAMAMPYKYGVTQMPCKARELEPLRGWAPAREPSGKIQWLTGPATNVRWSGIYGTCYITSPVPRAEMGAIERAALECECNGWLPKGVGPIPPP